ncbi:MAG TPA: DEAD/DEAH box helicase family protein, partial [Anaeromyxobacteraceae bacterium]|nr:DEAD/DEAH box helicase family protein [Anaeromyxobacteraceae bacterium]
MSFTPGLWPREEIRPAKSYAELAVYKALRANLPRGWSAWHSLRVRDRNNLLGEGDFVLAHPDRGALVLEVKGGAVEQRDGRWYSNAVALDRAPLDQAIGYAKRLAARCHEIGTPLPSFGAAACFPDVAVDRQPSEDDLAGVVLGKNHLAWLAEALPGIADRALPQPREVRAGWMDTLHRLWGETWVPTLSLGTRAKDLGDRFALTEQQLDTLEGLAENDRVLVQGGAGSGKTLIAAEAARREAAAGRRVLLLCFTKPLRQWLAARLEGHGVEVKTVSGLAWSVVNDAGQGTAARDVTETDYWRATLLRAGDLAEGRWDSVIIDEAQDLLEEAWLFVASIVGAGTRLWAFYDPAQGFWPERKPPTDLFERATRYRLVRGKRCPPGIQALANRWIGEPHDEAAIAAAFANRTLALVESPSATALHDKVGAEIDRLLSDGLTPGDIAIVSLRGHKAADAIFNAPAIGRHAFVGADAPDMEERLVADS